MSVYSAKASRWSVARNVMRSDPQKLGFAETFTWTYEPRCQMSTSRFVKVERVWQVVLHPYLRHAGPNGWVVDRLDRLAQGLRGLRSAPVREPQDRIVRPERVLHRGERERVPSERVHAEDRVEALVCVRK